MCSADTGPSTANSASSTVRRGAEKRPPFARRTAATSSSVSNVSRGLREARGMTGYAGSVCCSRADHFSSMRPKRQTDSATTHVTTNSPTMAYPT